MKSSCAAHASKQLLREQGSVPPNLAHHRPARWIQPLGPSENIPMTFVGSCPCGAAGVTLSALSPCPLPSKTREDFPLTNSWSRKRGPIALIRL